MTPRPSSSLPNNRTELLANVHTRLAMQVKLRQRPMTSMKNALLVFWTEVGAYCDTLLADRTATAQQHELYKQMRKSADRWMDQGPRTIPLLTMLQ